jgi:hypothetical protein
MNCLLAALEARVAVNYSSTRKPKSRLHNMRSYLSQRSFTKSNIFVRFYY